MEDNNSARRGGQSNGNSNSNQNVPLDDTIVDQSNPWGGPSLSHHYTTFVNSVEAFATHLENVKPGDCLLIQVTNMGQMTPSLVTSFISAPPILPSLPISPVPVERYQPPVQLRPPQRPLAVVRLGPLATERIRIGNTRMDADTAAASAAATSTTSTTTTTTTTTTITTTNPAGVVDIGEDVPGFVERANESDSGAMEWLDMGLRSWIADEDQAP